MRRAAAARRARKKAMAETTTAKKDVSRRTVLAAAIASAGFAGGAIAAGSDGDADAIAEVQRITGRAATPSPRLHLAMPSRFANGYTVPLTLRIDSKMTQADHVRQAQVLAPRNPINPVATFYFVPGRSEPLVSMRVRLAGPQDVLAIAEMSDGTVLMTRTFVEVASNGCE
jgi:sulfur-oxidizing protein SoxY